MDRLVWGYYLSYLYWARTAAIFAGQSPPPPGIPLWLLRAYHVANVALNGLNTYWFYLMTRKLLSYSSKRPADREGKKQT